jgi:hypothetical protein
MKARIEILTHAQGAESLELLRFVTEGIARGSRPKVLLYRGGTTQRVAWKNAQDAVDEIARARANRIEIVFPVSSQGERIEAILHLSPTSAVWLPTADFPTGPKVDKSQERSLASIAGSAIWNGLQSVPTVLEVLIETAGDEPERELGRLLLESFPPEALRLAPFGWVDFGKGDEKNALGPNVLERLAPWPKALPMLGSRLDALHPVLLGPRDLMARVEGTVGLEGPSRVISGESPSLVMAFLTVEKLEQSSSMQLDFFVPRDESTAQRSADPALGEFKFGEHVFFTHRRRRELTKLGMNFDFSPDHEAWLVLDERFCNLLSIDADDVIEDFSHKRNLEQIRKEIGNRFEALDSSIALPERVWIAHRDAYQAWTGGRGFFGSATMDLLGYIRALLKV